jgi:hypothetical protein
MISAQELGQVAILPVTSVHRGAREIDAEELGSRISPPIDRERVTFSAPEVQQRAAESP